MFHRQAIINNREELSSNEKESAAYARSFIENLIFIDTPDDHNCLFWSAALGLLLPYLEDKEAFYQMYDRLFGIGPLPLLEESENKDEELVLIEYPHTKESIRSILSTYDCQKETLLTYEGNILKTLVCAVFRGRVVNRMTEMFSDEDKQSILILANRDNPRIENWDDYVTTMQRSTVWGGDPEIRAMSQLAQVSIRVVSQGASDIDYPFAGSAQTLYLRHVNVKMKVDGNKNHYHYGLLKTIYEKLIQDKKQIQPVQIVISRQCSLDNNRREEPEASSLLDVVISPEAGAAAASIAAEEMLCANRRSDYKHQVFISHRGTHKEIAFAMMVIFSYFCNRSFAVFDQATLAKGRELSDELSRALSSSAHCLVLISEDFFTSNPPVKEVNAFLEEIEKEGRQGKRKLIPLFIGLSPEDCDPLEESKCYGEDCPKKLDEKTIQHRQEIAKKLSKMIGSRRQKEREESIRGFIIREMANLINELSGGANLALRPEFQSSIDPDLIGYIYDEAFAYYKEKGVVNASSLDKLIIKLNRETMGFQSKVEKRKINDEEESKEYYHVNEQGYDDNLRVCQGVTCETRFSPKTPPEELMRIFSGSLGYTTFSAMCEERGLSAKEHFKGLVFNKLPFKKKGKKCLIIDEADLSGSSFVECDFDKETRLIGVDFSNSNVTGMKIKTQQLYSCWVLDVLLCDTHQKDPTFIQTFHSVVDEQVKWIEKITEAGKDINDQWSSEELVVDRSVDSNSPFRFFSSKNINRIKKLYDENKKEPTVEVSSKMDRCILS